MPTPTLPPALPSILRERPRPWTTALATVLLAMSASSVAEQAPATTPPEDASTGPRQAKALIDTYRMYCLARLEKLDQPHRDIKRYPVMSPEAAAPYLAGRPGTAVRIEAGALGVFVFVAHPGQKRCAMHATRADTALARTLFSDFATDAPPPFVASPTDAPGESTGSAQTEITSYTWDATEAPYAIVMTLTTSDAPDALSQAIASGQLDAK